ncbi:transcription factor bHLH57-like [Nymphaea colorata]|nr:transcription factor bHLH57-like [Nymphaea colorata]
MESPQGPIINPCTFEDLYEYVQCYYEGGLARDSSYRGGWAPILSTESLRVGDGTPSTAFLQMLEGGRDRLSTTLLPTEPNFFLFSLQQQQQQQCSMEARVRAVELESCVTNASESQSPMKSEAKEKAKSRDEGNGEAGPMDRFEDGVLPGSSPPLHGSIRQMETEPDAVREKRRRRKRSRPSKNREEMESQRMTHIAVERNRRKQMNEHLNVLRALMPPSFIHRGDQASIIGGAIDFVKELEQLLQTLQARKRRKQCDVQELHQSPAAAIPFDGCSFMSPEHTTAYTSSTKCKNLMEDSPTDHGKGGDELMAESRPVLAAVEVTVIHTHANVKVRCGQRPGQLLKAISMLEQLNLTILHLNVTTANGSVFYSFNLKIGEGCSLGSADEITVAVQQIFS